MTNNTATPKHTPTPWTIEKPSKGCDVPIIHGSKFEEIAVMMHELSEEEIEANAQLIVKAVNSHEKLVEAIKDLLAAADTMNEHIDIWAYNKAIQALKSAGEI